MPLHCTFSQLLNRLDSANDREKQHREHFKPRNRGVNKMGGKHHRYADCLEPSDDQYASLKQQRRQAAESATVQKNDNKGLDDMDDDIMSTHSEESTVSHWGGHAITSALWGAKTDSSAAFAGPAWKQVDSEVERRTHKLTNRLRFEQYSTRRAEVRSMSSVTELFKRTQPTWKRSLGNNEAASAVRHSMRAAVYAVIFVLRISNFKPKIKKPTAASAARLLVKSKRAVSPFGGPSPLDQTPLKTKRPQSSPGIGLKPKTPTASSSPSGRSRRTPKGSQLKQKTSKPSATLLETELQHISDEAIARLSSAGKRPQSTPGAVQNVGRDPWQQRPWGWGLSNERAPSAQDQIVSLTTEQLIEAHQYIEKVTPKGTPFYVEPSVALKAARVVVDAWVPPEETDGDDRQRLLPTTEEMRIAASEPAPPEEVFDPEVPPEKNKFCPEFYYLQVNVEHPTLAMEGWQFTVQIVDIDAPHKPLLTYPNMKVNGDKYIIFDQVDNMETVFNPAESFQVPPVTLFNHRIQFQVFADEEGTGEMTVIVDGLVLLGAVPETPRVTTVASDPLRSARCHKQNCNCHQHRQPPAHVRLAETFVPPLPGHARRSPPKLVGHNPFVLREMSGALSQRSSPSYVGLHASIADPLVPSHVLGHLQDLRIGQPTVNHSASFASLDEYDSPLRHPRRKKKAATRKSRGGSDDDDATHHAQNQQHEPCAVTAATTATGAAHQASNCSSSNMNTSSPNTANKHHLGPTTTTNNTNTTTTNNTNTTTTNSNNNNNNNNNSNGYAPTNVVTSGIESSESASDLQASLAAIRSNIRSNLKLNQRM